MYFQINKRGLIARLMSAVYQDKIVLSQLWQSYSVSIAWNHLPPAGSGVICRKSMNSVLSVDVRRFFCFGE